MQDRKRIRDFLEYSYHLDLDNPLGRMMKEFMLGDVSGALEEISDFPPEMIVAELVSGRKEEYRLFVVDKTPSLLRMIMGDLWLDILLPPAYLDTFLSVPSADEEPQYFRERMDMLVSMVKEKTTGYEGVIERFDFEFNTMGHAFLPDEVRERVYARAV